MMEVGTIVKVIVEHPDGTYAHTKDDIGVIMDKTTRSDGVVDINVKSYYGTYLYGPEQLEELNIEDMKLCLTNYLRYGKLALNLEDK